MNSNLHNILKDRNVDLVVKLKLAASNELEFWEKRLNPPNLSKIQFINFLDYLEEGDIKRFSMDQRISQSGKYGKTGLDWIFKFELKLDIMGITRKYFCKGFFFEKNDLRGVEIQSFREVSLNLL